MRKQMREVSWVGDDDAKDGDKLDKISFKTDGHFSEAPCEWGNPHESLEPQQFFEVLDACVGRLPPAQGRLFLMREWQELSSAEVCKELNLTPTNLYVQLHRARFRLQACLNLKWFGRAIRLADQPESISTDKRFC